MDLVPNDKAKGLKTPVWDEYKKIVKAEEGIEVGACYQHKSGQRSDEYVMCLLQTACKVTCS